jgi:hypothetical protein
MWGVWLQGENLTATSGTNVWGRVLSNDDIGLVFVNNEAAAAGVACDAGCLLQLGIYSNVTLAVRDIWAGTNNGTVVSDAGLSVTVAGNGGCVFLRLTPHYDKAPYAA